MPIAELREHADRIVAAAGLDPAHRDYVGVLVNNEAWRDTLADDPLRAPAAADAEVPARRGQVPGAVRRVRPAVQEVRPVLDPGPAERGRAPRLRRARRRGLGDRDGDHPDRQDRRDRRRELPVGARARVPATWKPAAIPGIAIPLLQDDCIDTNVDIDWVWDVIHLTSDDRTYRLDLDGIRREVRGLVRRRRRSIACWARPTDETEPHRPRLADRRPASAGGRS